MKIAALIFVLAIAISVTAPYVCTPGENHETLCNECICVKRGRSQAWKCVRKKCDPKGDLKRYYQEKYKGQLIDLSASASTGTTVKMDAGAVEMDDNADNARKLNNRGAFMLTASHDGVSPVGDAPQVARYRYDNNNKYDL